MEYLISVHRKLSTGGGQWERCFHPFQDLVKQLKSSRDGKLLVLLLPGVENRMPSKKIRQIPGDRESNSR